MTRTLRLIGTVALLGTAACAADSPLAPQLAPAPAPAIQASADGPSTSGAPVIRLWCVGSVRADGPPPLYVVDGRETASVDGLDRASIERIEVMKGAAAVARYGPAAAHGVVIVTTRRGQAPRRD